MGRARLYLSKASLGKLRSSLMLIPLFDIITSPILILACTILYSSGKSKLVESMFGYVEVAGGYVVKKKLDSISYEGALSVVLSAMNDFCTLLKEKCSPQELDTIAVHLMDSFGSQLYTLCNLIPNVSTISPTLMNAVSSWQGSKIQQNIDTDMNMSSVHFILQLFVKAVTSREHPLLVRV